MMIQQISGSRREEKWYLRRKKRIEHGLSFRPCDMREIRMIPRSDLTSLLSMEVVSASIDQRRLSRHRCLLY